MDLFLSAGLPPPGRRLPVRHERRELPRAGGAALPVRPVQVIDAKKTTSRKKIPTCQKINKKGVKNKKIKLNC